MNVRAFSLYFVFLVALLGLPELAAAQQTVRCESNNGSRNYCNAPINNPNQVTMQRQISGSPCVRGSTWGVDERGIWVDKGCRADFNIGGGYIPPGPGMPGPGSSTIRCESNDGRRNYCNAPVNNPNQVTMQRQISGSPCVRGSSWGVDNRGIWVDRGCRADFTIGGGGGGYIPPGPGGPGPGSGSIKCESNDGRRNYCSTGYIDARQVSIQQQISGSPCRQGTSWGVDSRGLWVDKGCRAIFAISNWHGGGDNGCWNTGPGPGPWPPSGNWEGGNWAQGGACFYSDRNYGGKYLCLRRGESRNELGSLGDDISSIRVFGGARVLFYESSNFGGR